MTASTGCSSQDSTGSVSETTWLMLRTTQSVKKAMATGNQKRLQWRISWPKQNQTKNTCHQLDSDSSMISTDLLAPERTSSPKALRKVQLQKPGCGASNKRLFSIRKIETSSLWNEIYYETTMIIIYYMVWDDWVIYFFSCMKGSSLWNTEGAALSAEKKKAISKSWPQAFACKTNKL